jgi:hypothetical protein
MIDDLDDLLSNIDDTYGEYQSIKKAEDNQKARTARRSDRNLGDSDEVKTGYTAILKRMANDEEVRIFAPGYMDTLAKHWQLTQKLRELFSDLAVPESISDVMKKNRYTFLKYIQNIESLYNDFIAKQNPTALGKKARNEFHQFFPVEEQSQQRIDFMAIKELFLRIRELNARMRKEWTDLRSAVGVFNIVREGNAYAEEAGSLVTEGVELCRATDHFAKFLAVVIGIPEDDSDVLEKDIYNKIFFRESQNYDYLSIFEPEKRREIPDEQVLDPDAPEKAPVREEFIAEPARPSMTPTAPVTESTPASVTRAPLDLTPYFRLRGNSSWNTREPYLIQIDAAVFEKNMQELGSTVYFVERKEDYLHIQGTIKRAMISHLREKTGGMTQKYEEFLFKTLSLLTQKSATHFGFAPGEPSRLYTYHCGPATMYRVLRTHFDTDQTGLCFRVAGENRISKYYPEEFIKLSVMRWYESNINIFELPFDKIQDFNEVKRRIVDAYERRKADAQKKAAIAVSQHYLKTGKKITEADLMVAKARELFGAEHIPVFQRFVDRTIFR